MLGHSPTGGPKIEYYLGYPMFSLCKKEMYILVRLRLYSLTGNSIITELGNFSRSEMLENTVISYVIGVTGRAGRQKK